MQKLSLSIIKKLIDKKATSAEIDFLLYVSKYQNNHGVSEGIYYRQVCEELDISHQTFYDIKNSLIEKEIITSEKNSYTDHDITILDNDFSSSESYQKGYINTNYEVFRCAQFRNLTAGAKLLTLDLMKNNLASGRSFHLGTQKFFEEYTVRYKVCRRTLRDYLKMLRLIFSIGVKERQYYFTLRKFAKEKQSKNEEQKYRDNSIYVALRRNKLKRVRHEETKALDTMLSQYNQEIKKVFGTFSLSDVVEQSLKILNAGNEKKQTWKRQLKPNLIHRLLRKQLGLSVREIKFENAPV